MSYPSRSYPPSNEVNGGLLAGAILATIFCCLPFGIVSIVYAAKGEDETASKWIAASVVTGLIAIIIVIAIRSSGSS